LIPSLEPGFFTFNNNFALFVLVFVSSGEKGILVSRKKKKPSGNPETCPGLRFSPGLPGFAPELSPLITFPA
jgi:hypothetical protein